MRTPLGLSQRFRNIKAFVFQMLPDNSFAKMSSHDPRVSGGKSDPHMTTLATTKWWFYQVKYFINKEKTSTCTVISDRVTYARKADIQPCKP